MEINDNDRDYIADQIKQGFSSGMFGDGDGNRISWELQMEKFEE